MTLQELPAQATSLIHEITSISTCTSSTIETLKRLLDTEDAGATGKSLTASLRASKVPARNARLGRSAVNRSRKEPHITVLEEPWDFKGALSPREKSNVATQVVNNVLQSLNGALKDPNIIKSGKSKSCISKGKSKELITSKIKAEPKLPLKSRCTNRLSASPDAKPPLRQLYVDSNNLTPGLVAQAHCACIALAALRASRANETLRQGEVLNKFEDGVCALVGKLIALGLYDLATQELILLKMRIDSVKPVIEDNLSHYAMEPGEETLQNLLRCSEKARAEPNLSVTVALQTHVLKIIAARPTPTLVEAVLLAVQPNSPLSLVGLIQRQLTSDSQTVRDKAAHQLASLTHLLFGLCPHFPKIGNDRPAKSKSTNQSLTAFSLQTSALEMRAMWWKVADHRGDVAKEIWVPFSKCLRSFCQDSAMSGFERNTACKRAFETLLERVRSYGNDTIVSFGPQKQALLEVYEMMAGIARKSSVEADVKRWWKEASILLVKGKASQSRILSLRLRNAVLHLSASADLQDSHKLLEGLSLICQELDKLSPVHIEDLDDLLVSLSTFRRSFLLLAVKNHPNSMTSSIDVHDEIQDRCESLIVKVVRCLEHCFSTLNDRIGGAADYQRRKTLTRSLTQSYVESLIALAKRYSSSTDHWDRLEAGLHECIRVLRSLNCIESVNPHGVTSHTVTSLQVSVADMYWCRFLHLRKGQAELKELIRILDLSIQALDGESLQLETADILLGRLEQQAILYKRDMNYQNAEESYARALRFLISTGCLSVMAGAMAFQMPSQITSEHSRWSLLRRLLTAYLENMSTKKRDPGMEAGHIFDDETLSNGERGLLLEQQLEIVETTLASESNSHEINDAMRAIASTLLSLYTQESFPIRRLRVVNQLLRISEANPLFLSPDLHDKLCELIELDPCCIRSSQDSGIEGYRIHLLASHRIYVSLCSKIATPESICEALRAWSSVLQGMSDYDSLRRCIDDVPCYLRQLDCLTEYLRVHNFTRERLQALRLLIFSYEMVSPLQAASVVANLSKLGVQYARLGNLIEAGLTLRKAQRYLNTLDTDTSSILSSLWHLSHAEYCISIGNVEASENNTMQVHKSLRPTLSGEIPPKAKNGESSQWAGLNADLAHLSSTVAIAQGQPLKALYFSRLAVKLMHREWTNLRIPQREERTNGVLMPAKTKADDLVKSMSYLTIHDSAPPPYSETRYQIRTRRKMWCIVPRLFESLQQLSNLYAHVGLLAEAHYYMEQTQKVVSNVSSVSYQGRFHAQVGQYMSRSNDGDAAAIHFEKAELAFQSYQLDRSYVDYQLFLAEKYTLDVEFDSAESAFSSADSTLDHIMDELLSYGKSESSEISAIDTRMAGVTTTDSYTHPRINRGTSKGKASGPVNSCTKGPDKAPSTTMTLLRDERAHVLRQRALTSLRAGALDKAEELLEAATGTIADPNQRILQMLLEGQLCLHRGLEAMASDLNFCVLPESSISCPSLKLPHDHNAEMTQQSLEKKETVRRTKKPLMRTVMKATKAQVSSIQSGFFDNLQQAQESLSKICMIATKTASTTNIHTLVDVLSRTRMMLSSFNSSALKASTQPVGIVYVKEIGRTLASVRERVTLQIEQQLSSPFGSLDWPTFRDQKNPCSDNELDFSSDYSNFRTEYIDIIPIDWTVVSLSLSESNHEISLSRLCSGHNPFVISIPLNRHNSRDPDEETFGFDEGKAELQDIIKLANYSTHNTPATSRKGAKTEWWEARAALDARLKDFLVNVESIWFGGFRGIFSPDVHDKDLLLRFQQTLHNILDRHLPSRQKQTKSDKAGRFTLDVQLTELFVRLGKPDAADMDDELTDLLYFVVDVLQFHGEHNAYDEIDFDSIMVETLDALRQYHAAAEDTARTSDSQHIILVLDKALHAFPWESLPCMKSHSTSRVPSLEFLRHRILQQQAQSCSPEARFLVNPSSGAYVLNPSGDLTTTQSKFEESLAALADWTSIVKREPTEEELKTALQDKDLFLYFGHGSGGQYIRPRTIKRLEKCAVALLMGCSSGTMTEAGQYESYGTPLNYMHAGCPAVLATLWDVTDKDIDRFSQSVLEKWGLFETPQPVEDVGRGASPVKKNRGSPVKRCAKRGNGKEVVERREREKIGLDQAVAQSRDECIMKYLNGAAPVIYGIPVFLS